MATDLSEFAGKTALITGASSGLGIDFARQLADAGAHLVIVARRKDRLDALKAELAASSPATTVDVIAMDLMAKNAAAHLHAEIESWGRHVDILINNAGHGLFGYFVDLPLDRQRAMLELDIMVPTELAGLIAPGMIERRYGRVLFVSSMAGFVATPLYAAYAAAKSHVLLLSEALNFEWRGTGLNSTVLAPGVTATEFLDVAGQKTTLYQRMVMMESADVTRAGLEALVRRKSCIVPGWANKVTLFSTRFVPRAWLKWVAWFLMRNGGAS